MEVISSLTLLIAKAPCFLNKPFFSVADLESSGTGAKKTWNLNHHVLPPPFMIMLAGHEVGGGHDPIRGFPKITCQI